MFPKDERVKQERFYSNTLLHDEPISIETYSMNGFDCVKTNSRQ